MVHLAEAMEGDKGGSHSWNNGETTWWTCVVCGCTDKDCL